KLLMAIRYRAKLRSWIGWRRSWALWHQGDIFHVVGDIQGDRFLIVNRLGTVNGWVGGAAILGRITQVIEPEPRPSVPSMLDQLQAAYQALIQREQPAAKDVQRLASIVDDLRWYASRLGVERWNQMPRSNKWRFEQNVWRLTRRAKAAIAPVP